MKRSFRISWPARISGLAIVLLVAGCGAPAPVTTPLSTGEAPPFATLSAVQALVQRIRGSDNALSLKETDSPVPIEANDQVTVDENGRARLRFQDFLTVELFRNTQLQVGEPQLDLNTTGLIRLKEVFGHTRLELQKEVAQRIEIVSDFATISPTRAGTELITCHAPGVLTCVAATRGEAEVAAQGKVVTLEGGEATYIFKDQPPVPPVCANPETVRRWLDEFRSSADAGDLGSLVASFPQVSCADATRVAALPSDVASVVPTVAATATVSATAIVSPTATLTDTSYPTGTASTPPLAETPAASPSSTFIEGMVRIEGRAYTVGVDSQTPDAYHATAQPVTLSAFWIDEHEATNDQYKSFVDATGHPAPASWSGGSYASGREDHPVAGLSFADASAYCAWAGKRLPKEAEWEVAGRGPGAQPPMYPWGDEPTADGRVWQLSREETYPVGSATFNRSLFGVFDMAGNVWEWVDQPYLPLANGQQMLRGGRYGLIRDMAYRQPAAPDDRRFVPVAGVRCATDDAGG